MRQLVLTEKLEAFTRADVCDPLDGEHECHGQHPHCRSCLVAVALDRKAAGGAYCGECGDSGIWDYAHDPDYGYVRDPRAEPAECPYCPRCEECCVELRLHEDFNPRPRAA